ncbi:MAG: hypothetical protein ACYCPN_07270, partial [Thermoplasmata archaeon]
SRVRGGSRTARYWMSRGILRWGLIGVLKVSGRSVLGVSGTDKAESYPPGAANLKAIETVVKTLRKVLAREDPQRYGWQPLLRRLIAEVVTWQPRSFFILSYPGSCFSGDGKRGVSWPDPTWQKVQSPKSLPFRFTVRQRAFLEDHGYWMEAVAVVKRWPRSSIKRWEEVVHGKEYRVPLSIHERMDKAPARVPSRAR